MALGPRAESPSCGLPCASYWDVLGRSARWRLLRPFFSGMTFKPDAAVVRWDLVSATSTEVALELCCLVAVFRSPVGGYGVAGWRRVGEHGAPAPRAAVARRGPCRALILEWIIRQSDAFEHSAWLTSGRPVRTVV